MAPLEATIRVEAMCFMSNFINITDACLFIHLLWLFAVIFCLFHPLNFTGLYGNQISLPLHSITLKLCIYGGGDGGCGWCIFCLFNSNLILFVCSLFFSVSLFHIFSGLKSSRRCSANQNNNNNQI